MKKRLLSLLLVAGMLIGMLSVGLAEEYAFEDDDGTGTWKWASDYIYDCYEAGIINGYSNGTYLPDNELTRAEAAKIIALTFGLSSTATESTFSDVADTHWALQYIEACVEAGIINGYTDGTFLPSQNVTRAEMAKMIAVASGLTSSAKKSSFSDVSSSHWALQYIEACYDEGIITGYTDGTFLPGNNISRAEAAAIISRTLDLLNGDEDSDDAGSSGTGSGTNAGGTESDADDADTEDTSGGDDADADSDGTDIEEVTDELLEEFYEKDITDFSGYEVINLDSSMTTNFAVLAEDTTAVTADDSDNQLVSGSDSSGVYVISDITAEIAELKSGDILYYTWGDGTDDYVLLKVETITVSGDTATITADDDAEISDFFTYVDVDMDVDVTEDNFTPVSSSDMTYLGVVSGSNTSETLSSAASVDEDDLAEDVLTYEAVRLASVTVTSDDDSATAEIEAFSYTLDHTFSSGAKISGTVKVKLSVTVTIQYDAELFGEDYLLISAVAGQTTTLNGTLSGTLDGTEGTGSTSIGELNINLGYGLVLTGTINYIYKASATASVTIETENSGEIGIQYESGDGFSVISDSDADCSIAATGKLSLSNGLGLEVGISFLKVVGLSSEFSVLGTVSGEADLLDYGTDSVVAHACALCIDGKLSLDLALSANVTLVKKDIKQATPWSKSIDILEFYVSLLNEDGDLEFGYGECPHKLYLVTVTVEDSDGEPIQGATVTIGGDTVDETTDSDGQVTVWCAAGTYTVKASADGYTAKSTALEVEDGGETVTVSLTERVEITLGDEDDDSDGETDDSDGETGDNSDPDTEDDTAGDTEDDSAGNTGDDADAGYSYSEEDVVDSGTCGDDVNWILLKDGTLVILGTGNMKSYGSSNTPWDDYKTEILRVIIENGVSSIGSYAFYKCTELTSISFGSSITSIGSYAFYGCTSLVSVTIPDCVTSIGRYAFEYCENLTSIKIGDGLITIGWAAFKDCSQLAEVELGSNVSIIGNYAFAYCVNLAGIKIPSSVTEIDISAFEGCTSLASVQIDNAKATIGSYAFYKCTELTSISFGSSITSIGSYAFYGCTSLVSVTIPDGLTSIGTYAFRNCTDLTNITIPSSVTQIGAGAFSYCTSLTNITIPENLTTIENSVFYKCTSLTSIKIPDSVTSIQSSAFGYCSSLASIYIGEGLSSVGLYAFYKCNALVNVYYVGNSSEWADISISNYNSSLTSATIHYNYTE